MPLKQIRVNDEVRVTNPAIYRGVHVAPEYSLNALQEKVSALCREHLGQFLGSHGLNDRKECLDRLVYILAENELRGKRIPQVIVTQQRPEYQDVVGVVIGRNYAQTGYKLGNHGRLSGVLRHLILQVRVIEGQYKNTTFEIQVENVAKNTESIWADLE